MTADILQAIDVLAQKKFEEMKKEWIRQKKASESGLDNYELQNKI